MWRVWCFAAGLPLGALAGAAASGLGTAAAVLGALAGGAALLGLGSWLGRAGRAGPVAAAAQAGWLGLPALDAAWIGLAPGPRVMLAIVTLVLLGMLARASRSVAGSAASGGARRLVSAAAFLVLGYVFVLGLGAFLAARGSAAPYLGEGTAAVIYSLDAEVATRPLPRCRGDGATHEVLLASGAHPRLAAEGGEVWFDAAGGDGRRQIHRLDLGTRESACFTCDEPGNNRRPAPGARARSLVFDTDRHAGPVALANTELHQLRVPAESPSLGDGVRPRHPSRRLTYSPGRDDHAMLAPGGASVLWSRHEGGRFQVVSAGFRTGHGALLLATPAVVVSGRSAWAAPLGWSPDARAMALGRGNPLGPLAGEILDPATGETRALGGDLAGAGSVAFSADGGRMVLVAGTGAAGLGRLPASLGFVVGALPVAVAGGEASGGSRLRIGETGGELVAVELGEAGDWGAPTGVSLSPDGTWLVLGQRRVHEDGDARERLLRVDLACTFP